jgi:hypothetical protein
MAQLSTGVIVLLIFTIILLIVQMVLSSISSYYIGKAETGLADPTPPIPDQASDSTKAKRFATAAALTAAFSVVLLVGAMIVYIMHERAIVVAQSGLVRLNGGPIATAPAAVVG